MVLFGLLVPLVFWSRSKRLQVKSQQCLNWQMGPDVSVAETVLNLRINDRGQQQSLERFRSRCSRERSRNRFQLASWGGWTGEEGWVHIKLKFPVWPTWSTRPVRVERLFLSRCPLFRSRRATEITRVLRSDTA